MTSVLQNAEPVIGVVGLGYVGLPLAVEFGGRYRTIGFDINSARVDELRAGKDSSLEVGEEELRATPHLSYATSADDLRACNVYVVTVPTPITQSKTPDLAPLISASILLGKVVATRRCRDLRIDRVPWRHRRGLRAAARGGLGPEDE